MTPHRRRAAMFATTALLGVILPALPSMAAKSTPKPVPVATKKPAAVTKTPAPVTPTPTIPAKLTGTPTLASRLAAVRAAKSINYYPATAGWSRMWSGFDPAKVDADLARAASLGVTNVRAIVFPTTFGYPVPKAEYAGRLATFVNLAAARGMTVRLTLFDWWDGYADVPGSITWASALLKPYSNDPRIISVELQNELKPGNAAAAGWARKMVPAIRTAFPTMPLTISVDGGSGATGLAQLKTLLAASPLDYYDFHFYGNSERALATIRNAQATVAPTPMVIGEVGLNTLQNTEGEQAAFLARVFQAAAVAGVNSVAPWTLTDFAAGAIPDSAVAKLPPQYNYGLYRTNGTAKLAATVVRASFTGTALPATLLDTSFEAAVGLTPWRPYLPELGQAVKTQSAAHSGSWSISLTNTGKIPAGSPALRVAPITPVQPGQKWHAEVWARGVGVTGQNQIALSWFDNTDTWLGGTASAVLPKGTTGWTRLTVDGLAPVGAASLQIHLKSGDNSGTVWFDDVLLGVA